MVLFALFLKLDNTITVLHAYSTLYFIKYNELGGYCQRTILEYTKNVQEFDKALAFMIGLAADNFRKIGATLYIASDINMRYIKACTVSNLLTSFALCYIVLSRFVDCAGINKQKIFYAITYKF